ncbi:PhoH family protein [Aliifodinibius sp. S!AR15-10]|uniref:PhoH family protein n=1 Tax=Aliifodinibius sp. S!AR15-10 TaxID=2950437 RepID=UPI002854E086|nr:PhoH family protein [Aliifodinibius sp. S!AR15-10]MDR8393125.1 PhoH family protein [Aliifodinibius sp. S!AR15-10]
MARAKKKDKIFVLDTSVLLYDYDAVKNFQKNDIAIPITVLEELDTFKKGNNVINLHAREFIRYLDKISDKNMLQEWTPLNGQSHGKLRVLNNEDSEVDASEVFGNKKNDHRILNSTLKLMENEPGKDVILVSKDINLRIKARALNIPAEDYETVRVKDIDHLYKGKTEVKYNDSEVINEFYNEGKLNPQKVVDEQPVSNHFYILKNHSSSALGFYNSRTDQIEPVRKTSAYGVKPRNAEQTFALQAILDPEILLTTITGAAGTGKTLLALAGAMEQRRNFKQIYMARPIVPLSNNDIGYLPGDIKSKIDPYMQPLWDNLSFIKNQFPENSKEYKRIEEMVETEKLRIVPLAYIRGRSLSNVIFIVDEAQNLTPHEVKTIITRAGENTKIIFTGDIFQIDTPYLDTQSNGLSFLVDRMHNNDLYAHINLEKGERSELANLASKLL